MWCKTTGTTSQELRFIALKNRPNCRMKTKITIFCYIVLTFMLQACFNSCPIEQCGYPDIAFVELATLGGTLTTTNEEIENVGFVAIPNDGQSVSARLSFYFTPEEGRENLDEFEENELFFEVSEIYEMRFSQLSGDTFVSIAPTFTEWDPPNQNLIGYSSAIRLENSEPDLLINSNHLLHTDFGRSFVAPVNASHIELWRSTSSNESLLIRRIELASLAYWQEFIVPLLSGS